MTLPKSLELRLPPCLLEKQEQVDWRSHSQTSTYLQAACAGKDHSIDNSKTDGEMSRPPTQDTGLPPTQDTRLPPGVIICLQK